MMMGGGSTGTGPGPSVMTMTRRIVERVGYHVLVVVNGKGEGVGVEGPLHRNFLRLRNSLPRSFLKLI
jgi:hypothetical protein